MGINRINIIGSGNVANYLAQTLVNSVKIETIYSKNIAHALNLAARINAVGTDNLLELSKKVDLNIICVKDDVLAEVIENLDRSIPAVHTSGSQSIDKLLEFESYGILYPLQTITKARVSKIKVFPFLLEANSDSFAELLTEFCLKNLSSQVVYANSELRSKIHLAAVFANNFTNFFLAKSKVILEDAKVSFNILEPLMLETIEKAFEIGPENSQTGPAKRADLNLINKQMELIHDKELRQVYEQITNLIKREFTP